MKESGGLIKGMFTVSEVETFDTITSVEVLDIYAHCGQQIFGMRHFSEEWDEFYKSGSLAKALKDWDQSIMPHSSMLQTQLLSANRSRSRNETKGHGGAGWLFRSDNRGICNAN